MFGERNCGDFILMKRYNVLSEFREFRVIKWKDFDNLIIWDKWVIHIRTILDNPIKIPKFKTIFESRSNMVSIVTTVSELPFLSLHQLRTPEEHKFYQIKIKIF